MDNSVHIHLYMGRKYIDSLFILHTAADLFVKSIRNGLDLFSSVKSISSAFRITRRGKNEAEA